MDDNNMQQLKESKVYKVVPTLNNSKDCNVIKTSSKIDFENFCNNVKVVRILTKDNDILMWDAQELNHKEVSDYLLLRNYDNLWVEQGTLYWHSLADYNKAIRFISKWYRDKAKELDTNKRNIKLF